MRALFRLASARRGALALLVLLSYPRFADPVDAQQNSVQKWLEVIVESKDLDTEKNLSQTDFQIIQGRNTIPISSFAGGSEGTLRPLLIWFVVQCAEKRSVSSGSGFMLDKTDLSKQNLRGLFLLPLQLPFRLRNNSNYQTGFTDMLNSRSERSGGVRASANPLSNLFCSSAAFCGWSHTWVSPDGP